MFYDLIHTGFEGYLVQRWNPVRDAVDIAS